MVAESRAHGPGSTGDGCWGEGGGVLSRMESEERGSAAIGGTQPAYS